MPNQTTVAIIGYPNVGKSCLFNRLTNNFTGSVVSDYSGVTRDRLIAKCTWLQRNFWLIDTGGIEFKPGTEIGEQVQTQVTYAINSADLILLIFDNQLNLTAFDWVLIKHVLRSQLKVIIVVTKSDDVSHENDSYLSEIPPRIPLIYVSAVHNRNIGTLLNWIIAKLQLDNINSHAQTNILKFALIGQTNAGKSSLATIITPTSRTFVTSPQQNTTRDALNEYFRYKNIDFCLVDTPGLRVYHGKQRVENVLYYSYLRAIQAIVDADIILLTIDISKPINRQHKKMASLILAHKKIAIILLNKSDLLSPEHVKQNVRDAKHAFRHLQWIKILIVSAKRLRSKTQIIRAMLELWTRAHTYINRTKLNRFSHELVRNAKMPRSGQKTLKIYYIYQVKEQLLMMKFVIFVNRISLITPAFHKFLINRFYAGLASELANIPIELVFKSKDRQPLPVSHISQ